MGRITPSFRQLFEETISELRTELQAANNKKGLLPTIVEKFLNRRLHFECLSKDLSEESREYL